MPRIWSERLPSVKRPGGLAPCLFDRFGQPPLSCLPTMGDRMTRRIAATLALICALPLPALAQGEPARWTVDRDDRWCRASNRDAAEFGVAPYNGLWFFQRVGSDRVVMRVYFWPGAFTDDGTVTLTVQMKDSPVELSLGGKATGDGIVDLDEAMSRQDLDAMEAAGLVTLGASGIEPKLAFRTDGLSAALAALGSCAGRSGKG